MILLNLLTHKKYETDEKWSVIFSISILEKNENFLILEKILIEFILTNFGDFLHFLSAFGQTDELLGKYFMDILKSLVNLKQFLKANKMNEVLNSFLCRLAGVIKVLPDFRDFWTTKKILKQDLEND